MSLIEILTLLTMIFIVLKHKYRSWSILMILSKYDTVRLIILYNGLKFVVQGLLNYGNNQGEIANARFIRAVRLAVVGIKALNEKLAAVARYHFTLA